MAAKPAGTYLNPEDHVRYVLDFAARHRLHPDFAIYEPGFMRAGAVLARAAGTRVPSYRFMFCNQIAVGFPPKPYARSAYLALLEEEAPGAPWMIAGVSADIRPLIGEMVRRGGHIRAALRMRRSAQRRAISKWLKKPCAWLASMAPNRPRLPKCGKRWRAMIFSVIAMPWRRVFQ